MVIEEFAPGELTVPGAARRANIPESQVRYYLQAGQLPFVRRWGRVVIREDDLMRLVAARVRAHGPHHERAAR
jgi:helix-turn-helix protein